MSDSRRPSHLLDEIASGIVGRSAEVEVVAAAVLSGRNLLLEGPPGTSKSTILRAVTRALEAPFFFVEGNAELTPARLLGHHNPAEVLRDNYSEANFVYGPLPQAMREGGVLYLEELNRIPDDTINVLITALAEREVTIPRVGTVVARPSFRVVAAMNPFDNVGTGRIGYAVYDRFCRVAITYQGAEDEVAIATLRAPGGDDWLYRLGVAVARATRTHPSVRMGSSVRGAIDFVMLARELAGLREERLEPTADSLLLAAAQAAFSGRIALHETAESTPEAVIAEILAAALRTPSETEKKALTLT